MLSPAFSHFVAPARARPALWRLVLGALLCLAVYVGGVVALFGLLWLALGGGGAQVWAERAISAATPTATLLLLLSFLGMAAGPMLVVRLLHRRPAATLFGPPARAARHFVRTAAIVIALYAVSLGIWSLLFDPVANLDFGLWLSFLPLALAGVALQTGAEELVFRGYLQQQLAARFASPLVWALGPSVLFGLAHFDPTTNGANAWMIAASTAAFAVVAADLTARSGTLGAAWGFHFANNIMALLVIAVPGTLPGLALFLTPYGLDDDAVLRVALLGDLATLALAWGLCRRALRD